MSEFDTVECTVVDADTLMYCCSEFKRVRTCYDKGGIGTKYPAVFICSECNWRSTVFAFGKDMPQFCPSCCAKVVR